MYLSVWVSSVLYLSKYSLIKRRCVGYFLFFCVFLAFGTSYFNVFFFESLWFDFLTVLKFAKFLYFRKFRGIRISVARVG